MMRRGLLLLWVWSAVVAAAPPSSETGVEDRFRDPASPAISLLQPPQEALGELPKDGKGQVDWAAALRKRDIKPRAGLGEKEKMRTIELDIVMERTGTEAAVTFPHRAHTEWLTCSNCHSQLFLPQRGANFISQSAIERGEACGVCHGSVAFPVSDCARCHNTPLATSGGR